jgi:hypothetical protein
VDGEGSMLVDGYTLDSRIEDYGASLFGHFVYAHEWLFEAGEYVMWEQRNQGLKYESDCVGTGIGINIWIVEGFARDYFVEFLLSTPQSNQNILSVSEQVFIPAVSHMKIANVHVETVHQNVRIALQFSYQFAIFISVCNFHIGLQFSRFGV